MSGDLDAIREDVAMAARSAEMARHVALDHAPELLDEVERLRATIEQVSHIAYDPFISDGEALTRIQDLTDANLPPGEMPSAWLPEVSS
ncbi:hypothetical protein FK530_22975 [Tsukamurella conjunctivitidis]|uniref:Uncharacterized protein n=1 Tax=Tsukamurella conjunctivitidis TaxID=2592068 RepID=A0A5C5RTY6_9ACTN|nr:hypothetical protein [Tsukamurella conjunctivitidis]TWS25585.1 hypothetical protein FK530_22975 [Tsukamurella conjunctivitidis]